MKKEVLRMCIVCRQMKPKDELIRVVFRNPECTEYSIDVPKASGRGVYICRDEQCIHNCIKSKAFNRACKCNLPESIYEDLKKVELNEG